MTYIYWDDLAKSSYNYGTSLQFKGNSVVFNNSMIPSSAPLHQWNSQTNYQGNRQSPSLPLLKRKQQYKISLVADIEPANSLFVRIEFYNRFGESLGFELLKKDNLIFCYPKDAYTYSCSLINAGCQSFVFYYLVLEPVLEEENQISLDYNPKTFSISSNQQKLTLLLVERHERVPADLLTALDKTLSPLYIFKISSAGEQHFIREDIEGLLRKTIEEHPQIKIDILAYGPQGNFAALYYAQQFKQVTSFSNNIFLSKGKQMRLLNDLNQEKKYFCKQILLNREIVSNVKYYGFINDRPELLLTSSLISRSEQLRYLPQLKGVKTGYGNL